MSWYRAMILMLLVAVVGLALWASFSLGSPLGHSTRTIAWEERPGPGLIRLQTTGKVRELTPLMDWAQRYQIALAGWLGIPAQPVTVRMFADAQSMRSWCLDNLPGYTKAMNFCYVPGENTVYAYCEDLEWMRPRLQHELFHAIVRGAAGEPPLWLNEGTAELCEALQLGQDGQLQLSRVQTDRLRFAGRLALRGNLDPNALHQVSARDFYGKDAMRWYSLGYVTALWLARQGTLVDQLHGGTAPIDRMQWTSFVTDPAAWESARKALGNQFEPRPISALTPASAAAGLHANQDQP